MFEDFKWSKVLVLWLLICCLVAAVISLNMPEHPAPNETVLLPGYHFGKYAIYLFQAAVLLSIIRKRSFSLNFEVNLLEGFIALTGVALFIAPYIALLVKFIIQVVKN